jgi:hypothetical protein
MTNLAAPSSQYIHSGRRSRGSTIFVQIQNLRQKRRFEHCLVKVQNIEEMHAGTQNFFSSCAWFEVILIN